MRRREGELKAALMRELRAAGVFAVRREDSLRSGMPDIEAHGGARSTYWEGKHLEPGEAPDTRSIQFLTMLKLEATAFAAFYVLWIGEGADASSWTMVVRPSRLAAMDAAETFRCHDHASVAQFIRGHHAGR